MKKPKDLNQAIDLFTTFHQFEPTDIGEFHPDFHIPEFGYDIGEAERMYYRSNRLNPETGADEGEIDYVHFFEPGVRVVSFDSKHRTRERRFVMPKLGWLSSLALLGECLGYFVASEGSLLHAETTQPRPEWFAAPDGGAILVVERRQIVRSLLFGGELSVRPEGITG